MSLPYFPMFPTDFEAKTSHLTLTEDGAYNRLLRLMWMTPGCSLPDDDAWIKRRMRCTQEEYDAVVLVVIDEFCNRENGRVSNAKLSRVFAQSSEAHEKRVLAGAKGGKAKSLKTNNSAPSNAQAKPKQPEPEPEPYNKDTDVSFTKSPKPRKSRIDEGAVISEPMRKAAAKRNLSQSEAEAQFEKFKNDAIAKGKTFVVWDRAFVTWLDSEYFKLILTKEGRDGSASDMAKRVAQRFTERRMASGEGSGSVVPLLPAGQPGRDL